MLTIKNIKRTERARQREAKQKAHELQLSLWQDLLQWQSADKPGWCHQKGPAQPCAGFASQKTFLAAKSPLSSIALCCVLPKGAPRAPYGMHRAGHLRDGVIRALPQRHGPEGRCDLGLCDLIRGDQEQVESDSFFFLFFFRRHDNLQTDPL